MDSSDKSRIVRDISLYFALLLLAGWVAITYRALIAPLILSALFAYLLNPAVNLLVNRIKVKRVLAVCLVYVIFLAGTALLLVYVLPLVIVQAKLISVELRLARLQQLPLLETHLESFLGLDISFEQVISELQVSLTQFIQPENLFRLIQSATKNVVWVLIILVITFYLLKDWEKLKDWAFALAPKSTSDDLQRLYSEITGVWESYLRGQLFLMALVGILSWVVSAGLGLPGAVMLGLLAGTLDIIPSLGPAVATAVAALLALTQGSSHLPLSNAWLTVLVIVLFALIQLLENVVLQPVIMRRRLKIHPAIVFLAVTSSIALVGVVMALIVVPLIGTIEIILTFARHKHLKPERRDGEAELVAPQKTPTDGHSTYTKILDESTR